MEVSVDVLFVCMGNICRSPTAHGVFQKLVDQESLSKQVFVDSAGTYGYHIGKQPDSRAIKAASKRGYDLSNLRARKVAAEDFIKFDYVLAMDEENYADLLSQSDTEYHHKIKLFLEFSKYRNTKEVPDPYYGGGHGFEEVLDLVEDASSGLLEHIKQKIIQ